MNTKLIKEARTFAINAHGSQMYGKVPYAHHLDEVAKIASDYGELAEVVAFLHDIVEDTSITLAGVEDHFGSFVSRCVSILTDEAGKTRSERKSATYQKMALVEGEEQLALIVKAADRLANMRACIRAKNTRLLAMYKSEYDAFYQAVYRPTLCETIWQELEQIQNDSQDIKN